MAINPIDIKKDLDALALQDKQVAEAIGHYGYPEPRVWPSGFEIFLSIIVSQQISTQAARTILGRVRDLFDGQPDANALLALPDGALRTAGLSGRKVEYVTGLARAIIEERFSPAKLLLMENNEAIDYIVSLRGFGRWSAEIYLMFSLQRPDIFPADDLAIRKSLQNLKGLENCPTAGQAREIVEHWEPHRSVGSLFLWHSYKGLKETNTKN